MGMGICFIGHIPGRSDVQAFKSYPGSRMGLVFLVASSIIFFASKMLSYVGL